MSKIIKSEYNSLNDNNEYETRYFKTSADLVVGIGRMKSTAYSVGDVAYTDNNNKLSLLCTTAGTTSAEELDISSNSAGDTVADGGVVWKVVKRYTEITPITEGGTGANNVKQARANLGLGDLAILDNAITGASISGKVITLTFADGTTKTLTEDVTTIPANSDLDNYKTAGKYSCWLTTNAQSLSNNPMSDLVTGIVLEVIVDGSNILQIIYGTLVRGMYTRRYNNDAWNEWKNINNGIKRYYLEGASGYVVFENNLVVAWKRATIPETLTTITKPIAFTTWAIFTGDRGDSESGVTYPPMLRYDLSTSTTDSFIARGGPTNTFYIMWLGYYNN